MKKALISFLKLLHLLIIVVLFSLFFGEGWDEAYAQIVIEECVAVNPTPNIVLKPLAQHTIHVDLQWTPAEIATFMSVGGDPGQYPCQNFGNSGWQTTGFISYE